MSQLSPGFTLSQPPEATSPPAGLGEIPAEDSLWSEEHLRARYTQYTVTKTFHWNNGTLQVPIAAPVAGTLVECEVVSHSAPYGSLVVQWMAEREGEKPMLPDPQPTDLNLELESFTHSFVTSKMSEDGKTRIFLASGTIVYICKTPVPPSSGFPFAAVPYETTPKASNVYLASDFSQNII